MPAHPLHRESTAATDPSRATLGSPGAGADTHLPLSDARLDALLDHHARHARPAADRLWAYYRNPTAPTVPTSGEGGNHEPAQAAGLPSRLRGRGPSAAHPLERVIENDIAWRVHTLVDFMFGRSVALQSLAPDPSRAQTLENALRQLFARSGGIAFFQDLALLGCVYGHVDVLLRIDPDHPSGDPHNPLDPADPLASMRLEIVDPPRAIPLLDPTDYRRLDAYLIHAPRQAIDPVKPTMLDRVRHRLWGHPAAAAGDIREYERVDEWTEVFTADRRALYLREGNAIGNERRMTELEVNRLGRVPVVHIQNLPQPFVWEGLGDVEPLIPLQDELNTRLSDRANRVTFQSFKMYLGRGIDGFIERPVGPGQMWQTDNPDASIQEFGGDADTPSEAAHINEIREAMDKMSGVSPVAAGILRGKVGNLTSENALRIVLMGLLARTQKKRITYGRGIEAMCELALHAADVLGTLTTTPDERGVRVDWPDPLPEAQSQRLRDAQLKLDLGVPRKRVLAELGYEEACEE